MKLFQIHKLPALYNALAGCQNHVHYVTDHGDPVAVPHSAREVEQMLRPIAANDCIPSLELNFASSSDCCDVIMHTR